MSIKNIVDAIAKTDKNNITEYQTKPFATFTNDLINCRNWLVDNNRFDSPLNKNIKNNNKKVQNTDDMISYLIELDYNVTLQNN